MLQFKVKGSDRDLPIKKAVFKALSPLHWYK